MLKIITNCENCNCDLPNESEEAMMCSFECTFCASCVRNILDNVCPNCGGGFEKRPTRPKNQLAKYSISGKGPFRPIDADAHKELLKQYQFIHPAKR